MKHINDIDESSIYPRLILDFQFYYDRNNREYVCTDNLTGSCESKDKYHISTKRKVSSECIVRERHDCLDKKTMKIDKDRDLINGRRRCISVMVAYNSVGIVNRMDSEVDYIRKLLFDTSIFSNKCDVQNELTGDGSERK